MIAMRSVDLDLHKQFSSILLRRILKLQVLVFVWHDLLQGRFLQRDCVATQTPSIDFANELTQVFILVTSNHGTASWRWRVSCVRSLQ
jgi:hypothetical protein